MMLPYPIESSGFLRSSLLFLTCLLVWEPVRSQARPDSEPVPPTVSGVTNEQVDRVLEWNARSQHLDAKIEDNIWDLSFRVTNHSIEPQPILAVQPSCGCTVAQLPADPWIIAPGATEELKVRVDYTGKEGDLTKEVHVISSLGQQTLLLTLHIPPRAIAASPERSANLKIAMADRQAVFRNDCARCHATPALGKTGVALYMAACGICHDTPNRASMVPDLGIPKIRRDEAYWRNIITHGRPGTLMPAFAKSEGGPLPPDQIDSLVSYLVATFIKEPPH